MPAAGPPSASGARRGGDRFQDLFVWAAAMQAIGPGSTYTQVEVEINGVGNVDDVVLRSAVGGSDVYAQVKWATNASEPLTEEYLLSQKKRRGGPVGESLLRKLHRSYRTLRGSSAAPTLRLITNRALDREHPMLGHLDGRTQLLVPAVAHAGRNTATGKAVDMWARHLGASREELLEMLEHLEFHPGRTLPAERDHVRALMVAAGLDGSNTALQHGVDTVTNWVIDGKRILTIGDINKAIDQRALRRTDPSALLVVQAIDTDPHASDATLALNWVHLYDTSQSPGLRVQPLDSASWNQMDQDITDAAATLEETGWRSTVLRGALRQATFFRVGAALPHVRGHALRYLQGRQWWSTDTPKAPIDPPQVSRSSIGSGPDLAVAIGVATDATTAVAEYLRRQATPVSELVTMQPAGGADDQAITGAGQAVAYAQRIRDLVREELDRQSSVEQVHLFLAGPGGLALLLGHRWNRIRPTVVYEHLGRGRGYTAAFVINV